MSCNFFDSEPMATIDKSITTKDESAPYVVWFSSRGPNPITLDILKVRTKIAEPLLFIYNIYIYMHVHF